MVANLRQEHQSSAVWAMVAYRSQGGSRNYLHISVPATQLQPGNALPVSFSLRNSDAGSQGQIHYFTYLVRGSISVCAAGEEEVTGGWQSGLLGSSPRTGRGVESRTPGFPSWLYVILC